MDFSLKTYKNLKIKSCFKTTNFLFFLHGISSKKTNWIKIEQLLKTYTLSYFWVLNSLSINILKNSIFKNLVFLIQGPIFIFTNNNRRLGLKSLENLSLFIDLLCLRLNDKVYSRKQIKGLKKLSYIKNITLFYMSMQLFVKLLYCKLKYKK